MPATEIRTVVTRTRYGTEIRDYWTPEPAGPGDLAMLRGATRPPKGREAEFTVALDATRGYDAGDRDSIGTYTEARAGHCVAALAAAGMLAAAAPLPGGDTQTRNLMSRLGALRPAHEQAAAVAAAAAEGHYAANGGRTGYREQHRAARIVRALHAAGLLA